MKLSVALCTYNGENYLKEQLDSILQQTMSIHEIIVCDDCSQDGTWSLLEQYAERYPSIFRIFKNSVPLKTVKNFEKCIMLTTGNYIFLSDQDDIWCSGKVEKMMQFFAENQGCSVLFSNGFLLDQMSTDVHETLFGRWGFDSVQQERWTDNNIALQDLINNVNKITGATVCFKSSLKNNFLPIETPCAFWHDAWIGMHAAKEDGLRFIDECLIYYRIHGGQQVGVQQGWSRGFDDKGCVDKEKKYNEYLKANFQAVYKSYNNRPRSLAEKIAARLKKILK